MYFKNLALVAGVAVANLAAPAHARSQTETQSQTQTMPDAGQTSPDGTTADAGASARPAPVDGGLDNPRPFSGLYVGGVVSYDVQPNDIGSALRFNRAGSTSVTTATGEDAFAPGFCNGAASGATPDGGCRNDRDDIGYYGRVGFDIQAKALVFGALAEFGKSEIADSTSGFSTTPASYTLTRKLDWELGLRGRLGFAARTTLFYGTGGAGLIRVQNRFATTNTANAFVTNRGGEQWGYQVGGGIEQKIGRHFSFGLEYLYHDYDDRNFRVFAGQGSAPATNPFILNSPGGTEIRRSDTRFDWHSLRLTAAFRF